MPSSIEDSVSEVTSFKTSDGQQFRTLEEAYAHEARIRLRAVCERIAQGGGWEARALAERIEEHRDDLLDILDHLPGSDQRRAT